MAEEKAWRGSPLDAAGEMDPYGVREVVFEFDNEDEDVFRPRLREEFGSYELNQLATYIETVSHTLKRLR